MEKFGQDGHHQIYTVKDYFVLRIDRRRQGGKQKARLKDQGKDDSDLSRAGEVKWSRNGYVL